MRRAVAIAFALATLAAAPHAYADAIDGEWCSPNGENILIDGPKIRLTSGANITGQYTRHEFAYQVPEGEPGAGQIIHMQQLSEEMMKLRRIKDGVASEAENWRRCNVTS